jgi:hypothetical protein
MPASDAMLTIAPPLARAARVGAAQVDPGDEAPLAHRQFLGRHRALRHTALRIHCSHGRIDGRVAHIERTHKAPGGHGKHLYAGLADAAGATGHHDHPSR